MKNIGNQVRTAFQGWNGVWNSLWIVWAFVVSAAPFFAKPYMVNGVRDQFVPLFWLCVALVISVVMYSCIKLLSQQQIHHKWRAPFVAVMVVVLVSLVGVLFHREQIMLVRLFEDIWKSADTTVWPAPFEQIAFYPLALFFTIVFPTAVLGILQDSVAIDIYIPAIVFVTIFPLYIIATSVNDKYAPKILKGIYYCYLLYILVSLAFSVRYGLPLWG